MEVGELRKRMQLIFLKEVSLTITRTFFLLSEITKHCNRHDFNLMVKHMLASRFYWDKVQHLERLQLITCQACFPTLK